MINERYELPVKSALILLWAGAVMGMYYLSESVGDPLVVRFYEFMLVNPLMLISGSFLTAKAFGTKWYYKAATIAVSAVIYFATPMHGVVPNILIVTVICVILGSGVGGVFSEKFITPEPLEKEHYTPILAEENSNGNKKNSKKKAKRK